MIITTDQLKQIVATGGGLVLDVSEMTFNQLKDILSAANSSKAQITLKNLSGLTAMQLQELSSLAPSLIAFDLTTT
jgi:hypothetical protein